MQALLAIHLLALSTWVGGFVAIFVVARTATRTLDQHARVAFFRSLGRAYGIVGGAALLITIGTGLALAWPPDEWDGMRQATVALAGAVVVVLAVAVRQARAMTRRRRRALESPGNPDLAAEIRRHARAAGILRAALGLLSIAAVVTGALSVHVQ